jgi:hypothetical protein
MDLLNFAKTVNQFALMLILGLVLVLIAEPQLAGRWKAERDIAYDAIWMTHVGDCDCTESFD